MCWILVKEVQRTSVEYFAFVSDLADKCCYQDLKQFKVRTYILLSVCKKIRLTHLLTVIDIAFIRNPPTH